MKDIKKITSKLEPYLDFIYNHECEFFKYFKIDGDILEEVSFKNYWMKFVYITPEGKHISDDLLLRKFMKWINEMEKDK